MRLSTKGRYGVLAMYELACCHGKGPVSIREIAKKQNFSTSYMEQLFADLKKSGLIVSTRGAKGGYILAKDPDKISVGEVIRALEGPIEFSECVGGQGKQVCNKSADCATRGLWQKINDGINDIINNCTLQDLMNQ